MATTLHVCDRRIIMRRAWAIARQRREETARRAYDASVRIVGARIIHPRPLAAFIAETPLDLSTAMKVAWAEAKRANDRHSQAGALVAVRPGGAVTMHRRMRFARVFRLMGAAARWIGARFIPSRAA